MQAKPPRQSDPTRHPRNRAASDRPPGWRSRRAFPFRDPHSPQSVKPRLEVHDPVDTGRLLGKGGASQPVRIRSVPAEERSQTSPPVQQVISITAGQHVASRRVRRIAAGGIQGIVPGAAVQIIGTPVPPGAVLVQFIRTVPSGKKIRSRPTIQDIVAAFPLDAIIPRVTADEVRTATSQNDVVSIPTPDPVMILHAENQIITSLAIQVLCINEVSVRSLRTVSTRYGVSTTTPQQRIRTTATVYAVLSLPLRAPRRLHLRRR